MASWILESLFHDDCMTYIRTIFTLLFLLSHIPVASAQEASDFTVTNYNSDNGLPQNSVMQIEVDKSGFIWLATQAGLVRFDGSHFQVYDQHNTRAMKYSRIIDLGLMSDSTVFCRNSAYNVLTFDENNAPSVSDYTIQNQAMVIYSSRRRFNVIDSLHEKDRVSVQNYFHPPNVPFSVATVQFDEVGKAGEGFLRLGDNHVWYLEKRRIRMYKHLGPKRYRIVAVNQAGVLARNLYFFYGPTGISRLGHDGEEASVSLFDLKARKPIVLDDGPKSFFQQGKQLFLLHKGIVYRLQVSGENQLLGDPILNTGNLTDINSYRYVPRLGIHVAGTSTRGLFIFKEKQFKTVSIPGKSGNFYSQLIYKKDAVITEQGIIFPDHTYTGYPFPLGPRAGMFEDSQKHVWLTDLYGITIVMDQDLNVIRRIPLQKHLSDADQDSEGNVWVSTFSSRFGKVVGDSVQWLNKDDEMPNAYTAIPIGKNQLWATNKECYYILNTKTKTVSERVEIDSTEIRALYQDKKRIRWIGTYGRGFYAHWNGKRRSLPLDRNGYLLYTHSFREDQQGFLWMSTNHGLFKCKIRDLYDYLEGKLKTVYYYYYDKSNGFNTNEFNGGCSPSSVAFADGKFSYPSMDGLVQFYPDSLHDILPSSEILIDRFITDGKYQPFTKELRLDPALDRIEIKIASPYYGTLENQFLEYNVAGLDYKWYPVDASGTITLNRLEHGDYTLQVRKQAGFGKDNLAFLTKQFTVEPFWYQTWYFRLFLLLLAAAFVFALMRLRYFYLINRKRELEVQVKERTTQLEYSNKLKDKITMLLAHDLQSPLHFLNVLSEYVSVSVDKNEYQEAKTGIHEIKKAAGKIHAFISDINLWTKSQQETFYYTKKSFSFLELMAELKVFFAEMLLIQNNKLEIHCEECELFTNREILKAVLRNLIDNSNKHTKNGSIVVMLVEGSDDTLTLIVSDNGGGMSPADVKRINHRIENVMTTEGIDHSGRLGYQIIIDFVSILKAKLTLQSEKGQGTMVKISGLSAYTESHNATSGQKTHIFQ
jgi:signal transduction histidine kinase